MGGKALAAASVGVGASCEGSFSNWERSVDGLRLTQAWPGAHACLAGPAWLPERACTSSRRFLFTSVGTCPLRCVRISSSGEIDCTC